MSDEKINLFESWLKEFHGRHWLNPEAMPEGVYGVLQDYKHFNIHRRGNEEKADKKINEAITNFRKLTGYNIFDFIRYQDMRDKKLER